MQKKAEQLEIFLINNNYATPKLREYGFSFLTCIRAYEKIILAIICLLIMGLFSFSLGVKHGKKISLRKIASENLDLAMHKSEGIKENMPLPAPIAPNKIEAQKNEKIQQVLLPVKQVVVKKIEKPKVVTKQNIQPKQAEKSKKAEKAEITGINSSAYTIQVASFKVRNEALKEVESLKKKGFTSIVLNKGSHLIVCVGNYSNKEQALASLKELKKKYGDCLLRRL